MKRARSTKWAALHSQFTHRIEVSDSLNAKRKLVEWELFGRPPKKLISELISMEVRASIGHAYNVE